MLFFFSSADPALWQITDLLTCPLVPPSLFFEGECVWTCLCALRSAFDKDNVHQIRLLVSLTYCRHLKSKVCKRVLIIVEANAGKDIYALLIQSQKTSLYHKLLRHKLQPTNSLYLTWPTLLRLNLLFKPLRHPINVSAFSAVLPRTELWLDQLDFVTLSTRHPLLPLPRPPLPHSAGTLTSAPKWPWLCSLARL